MHRRRKRGSQIRLPDLYRPDPQRHLVPTGKTPGPDKERLHLVVGGMLYDPSVNAALGFEGREKEKKRTRNPGLRKTPAKPPGARTSDGRWGCLAPFRGVRGRRGRRASTIAPSPSSTSVSPTDPGISLAARGWLPPTSGLVRVCSVQRVPTGIVQPKNTCTYTKRGEGDALIHIPADFPRHRGNKSASTNKIQINQAHRHANTHEALAVADFRNPP